MTTYKMTGSHIARELQHEMLNLDQAATSVKRAAYSAAFSAVDDNRIEYGWSKTDLLTSLESLENKVAEIRARIAAYELDADK